MKILEKIIEYGLYLFVFLLPWQARLILKEGNLNGYWEYGTISIYATEILLWIVFVAAAGRWIVNKTKNQKPKTKNTNGKLQNSVSRFLSFSVFWFLSFFVLWSAVSIFWSDSKSVALQAWLRLIEGLGLFLVLRCVKFNAVKLVWILVISAVLQAGLGVWQFLSQSTFASKWLGMAFHDPIEPGTSVVETTLRRWLRAYGLLPHPNILAGFLAVGMLGAIWLYQKTEYSFKKLLLPVCFIILTLGLFATFSKSAIIALVISFFFLLLFTLILQGIEVDKKMYWREKKFSLLKFILIFICLFVIFSAVFWEPVSTRIYGQDRLEVKSISERLSYFDQAWQLIKKYPFLGVGIGNYTLAVHNEINPDLKSWDYQPVHNIYLLAGVELGFVGFVFVFLFFGFSVFWFWKLFRKKDFASLTLFSIVLFIAMVGFFDHYLWTLYFGILLFWLCLGLNCDIKYQILKIKNKI